MGTSGSRPSTGSLRDAFEGALVGLAVGDALGFPAEFRSRSQILASFGPKGLVGFVAVDDPAWPRSTMVAGAGHPAGTFSDDTQMTIAVARALIEGPGDGLDAIMGRMAREFVRWSRSPDNDRAPGSACMTGCASLARGTPWRVAGVRDSKGCGSAMRVAPIGLVFHRDRERLLQVARASSLLTHGHDAAVEGAAAAALAVALALDHRSPSAIVDALTEECAPRSPDLRRCFDRLRALLDEEPERALSRSGIGEGWVAEEAVASALYCFLRSPEDYAATVLAAANTDGDSDSIACIAGSISGAYNGARAIPRAWRDGVEGSQMLGDLAARLCEAAGSVRPARGIAGGLG